MRRRSHLEPPLRARSDASCSARVQSLCSGIALKYREPSIAERLRLDAPRHPRAGGTPTRQQCTSRRQARTGAGLSDQDIEEALRRKAATGDVAAARELRERTRTHVATHEQQLSHVALEEMSDEELGALRERLLSMAVRMNDRAARARAAEGEAPPR